MRHTSRQSPSRTPLANFCLPLFTILFAVVLMPVSGWAQGPFVLTVATTGSGTVTSADGYINCPGVCTYSYPSGTSVTLTATPASGWSPTAWEGCDSPFGNHCTLTMNNTRWVGMTFTQVVNCPQEPAQNTLLVSGQTYGGSNCFFSTSGDVDTFVFQGTAGETWRIVGGFGPNYRSSNFCVTLYAPNGYPNNPLPPWPKCTSNPPTAVFNTQTLPTTGTYTIKLTELNNGSTYFALSAERINPPPLDASPLTFSKNISAGIAAQTAQQPYTFPADPTGIYQITLSFISGSDNACFDVYAPSGANLSSANCTLNGQKQSATYNLAPVETGTYLVAVYTTTNDGSVYYNLQVTCLQGDNCSSPLSVSNVGNGTVNSSDGFIACGSTCNHNYVTGTTPVTLTATPASGWIFGSWSGCDSTSGNTCTVTMNNAKNVTATFTLPTYPLTVTKVGSGTVTSADGNINCGSVCTFNYGSGTSVTLTATPTVGWALTSWSGCDSTSGNTCTVTVNNARNVTATFTQVGYPLTVSKTGSGTVTSSDGNINCGGACSYTYLGGTSVTLTATPASGYSFTGWSGGGCSGTGSCVVNMTQAQSVSASFTPTYQLTLSKTGSGTVTSTDGNINCGSVCSYSYLSGTKVTLNANPSSGWAFTGWSGACTGTGACMVTMTQAQSVSATFVQLFQLTVSATGSGTVTSSDGNLNCGTSCSYNYPSGTSVTLNAAPASGWSFSSWTGCNSTSGNTCAVTVNSARSVTATFVQSSYTLTAAVTGNGTITSSDTNINCSNSGGPVCSFTYLGGTPVTLTATPSSGWTLYGWSGCDVVNGNSCNITVNSAGAVTATFTQISYLLSVFTIGTGDGTITSSDGKIDCGTVCSSSDNIGTTVTLTADAEFDATFGGWTGCDTTSGPTCTVTMNNARSVTATFTSGFGGLRFVPVPPCRVADTRNPDGLFGGPPIPGGTSRDFPIPLSNCGIPPDAEAYALNLTVVPHGFLGYLTVWPTGIAKPVVSTLNSYDGRIKANAAILAAGTDGSISAYVTDTTDLIIDVSGYFVNDVTQLQFYPLAPCRVLDTRNPVGSLGGPEMAAGQQRDFPILTSSCHIPSTAQAYSLNFTVVPDSTLGYLTVWQSGKQRPVVSTLNSPTGAVTANAAIVPAGANGAISTYVTDRTQLIADINGYFAPAGSGGQSLYVAYPCRQYDTRSIGGGFQGPRKIAVTGVPCAIPATAQAVVFNATVLPQGFLGYLTLWPDGTSRPVVSTLNSYDGAITSNMAIVPTANGLIDAFTTNTTDLILDILSYFAP